MKNYFFYANGDVISLSPLQVNEGFAHGLVELSEEDLVLLNNKSIESLTPQHISRAQGKAALIMRGIWQGVLDYINSIEDDQQKSLAEVALNDTTHWQRSSPFLNSAAEALGLTDEQLDQLFIDASKIEL